MKIEIRNTDKQYRKKITWWNLKASISPAVDYHLQEVILLLFVFEYIDDLHRIKFLNYFKLISKFYKKRNFTCNSNNILYTNVYKINYLKLSGGKENKTRSHYSINEKEKRHSTAIVKIIIGIKVQHAYP